MKNIIAENKKYVRAVIRKFVGTTDEDIEQEVYVRIWQNLSNYTEKGRLKQWICTLTANVCRDWLRSKSCKAGKLEIGSKNGAEDIVVNGLQEEIADLKKRQKIILKAVDNLPKHYREVIILFEFEEYSIEKIATKLRVPVGTVKSRLYNARKILKEKLSFLKGD